MKNNTKRLSYDSVTSESSSTDTPNGVDRVIYVDAPVSNDSQFSAVRPPTHNKSRAWLNFTIIHHVIWAIWFISLSIFGSIPGTSLCSDCVRLSVAWKEFAGVFRTYPSVVEAVVLIYFIGSIFLKFFEMVINDVFFLWNFSLFNNVFESLPQRVVGLEIYLQKLKLIMKMFSQWLLQCQWSVGSDTASRNCLSRRVI